jgi:hypothetical protein
VALGLGLFRGDKAGGFGDAYALAGHFADYLGGGEDFLLWFARHGLAPGLSKLHPAKSRSFAALRMTPCNNEQTTNKEPLAGIRIFAHSCRQKCNNLEAGVQVELSRWGESWLELSLALSLELRD